jgi:hypothetical protein
MQISGCQWSGVATMQISGFSLSSRSRKSLYCLGELLDFFLISATASSFIDWSTSHTAIISTDPSAMAISVITFPHQPDPIRAVRYFLPVLAA